MDKYELFHVLFLVLACLLPIYGAMLTNDRINRKRKDLGLK